jgi:hypothetical protein
MLDSFKAERSLSIYDYSKESDIRLQRQGQDI